jgi:hypothetical protein
VAPAAKTSSSWPAYAAAIAAFSFALPSLYWAAGGMAGVGTLGGRIEELARQRDSGLMIATWAAFVLKVLGGVLALGLVRRWGRRLPRRLVLFVAWGGASLLTVYGLLQTATVALIATGVMDDRQGLSSGALRWRLLLWEPWFLIWGLLLGLAAWRFGRTREVRAPGGPTARPLAGRWPGRSRR